MANILQLKKLHIFKLSINFVSIFVALLVITVPAYALDAQCNPTVQGTIQVAEPSRASACSSGSYINGPADTATQWNWSCVIIATPSGIGGSNSLASCYALKPVAQPQPASCALPWGGSIPSGSSVTAYQSSSAVSPATCVSEQRTCNNDVLSGSFTNQSCAVVINGACGTGDGTTVATEPAGSAACSAGTLDSTNPTDTSTQWNWMCNGSGGSSASCSANKLTYTLTASVSPSGSGTVMASGISCPGDCSQSYTSGTLVNIVASNLSGYTFSGWTGACEGQLSSCRVTMSGNRSTTANFVANSCANGANNPPSCNVCIPPNVYNGSSCVAPAPQISITANPVGAITLPTTSFTQRYTLTGGTSANTNCRLLDNVSNPLTSYAPCSGSISWNAPAVAGTYAYYVRANKASTGETRTSNRFTVTVNDAPSGSGSGTSCSLPWGGSIPSGSSVTAYQSPSAPSLSSCVSQTRTCTNGTLSGSYTNQNCVSTGALSVTCSADPRSVALGEPVTFTADPRGGNPPYTYSWSGSDLPTSPAPSTNPYVKSYSTIGQKSAVVRVTDRDSMRAVCDPAATVQVNFSPTFEEI